MLPSMREDACQLACLAAELRLAALVDGATGAGAAARQVQAVLRHLFALLHETGPAVMRRLCGSSGGPEGPGGMAAGQAAGVYLAWLLDAAQCAAAYIASTDMPQVGAPASDGCWVGVSARQRSCCCAVLPVHKT